jgi:hypothetical protein
MLNSGGAGTVTLDPIVAESMDDLTASMRRAVQRDLESSPWLSFRGALARCEAARRAAQEVADTRAAGGVVGAEPVKACLTHKKIAHQRSPAGLARPDTRPSRSGDRPIGEVSRFIGLSLRN